MRASELRAFAQANRTRGGTAAIPAALDVYRVKNRRQP
jgi:hypothetical protein